MADRAFSTRPVQWAHIMPSIFMVFVIVFLPPCLSVMFSRSRGAVPGVPERNLLRKNRRRRALLTTVTELRLMADIEATQNTKELQDLAILSLSSQPFL